MAPTTSDATAEATTDVTRPEVNGRPSGELAIAAQDLTVAYGGGRRAFRAVEDFAISVAPGESVGLVGESGSGKSTVAKALMGLVRPAAGSIEVDGISPIDLDERALRRYWEHVQMIFQDPISSLNPRRRVEDCVRLPLDRHHRGTPSERRTRVAELLEMVGLDVDHHGHKRPTELSGGQCQRVAIARAMALEPRVLLCDEPVSALDVSVQAQILNLLNELRAEHDLTLLFISHDLAVVRAVTDRVAVMYRGRTCEQASVDAIFEARAHPYTDLLIRSIPGEGTALDADGESVRADVDGGCPFYGRCHHASDRCRAAPPLDAFDESADHLVACWHPVASHSVPPETGPAADRR